jgi:hypothetical protein
MMKTLSALALATALAAANTVAATAQERPMMATPHAYNPSLSLSAPTSNPFAEQRREDYATGLQQEQRQLMQQNPSGLGRQELEIGRELNGYTPR